MNLWISVKEQEFPINKNILVTEGKNVCIAIVDKYFKKLDCTNGCCCGHHNPCVVYNYNSKGKIDITHWMPLPTDPDISQSEQSSL